MVADEEGLKVKDLLESSRVEDPSAATKTKEKGKSSIDHRSLFQFFSPHLNNTICFFIIFVRCC